MDVIFCFARKISVCRDVTLLADSQCFGNEAAGGNVNGVEVAVGVETVMQQNCCAKSTPALI